MHQLALQLCAPRPLASGQGGALLAPLLLAALLLALLVGLQALGNRS